MSILGIFFLCSYFFTYTWADPPVSLATNSSNLVTAVGSNVNIQTIVTGGAPTSWSISPALPTGLVLNSDGSITGQSLYEIAPYRNFTLTATNADGSCNSNIALRINAQTLSGFSMTPNAQTVTKNNYITPIIPVLAANNNPVLFYTCNLPWNGISLDPSTGMITGRPTDPGGIGVTIVGVSSAGSTAAGFSINVLDYPPVDLYYPFGKYVTITKGIYCNFDLGFNQVIGGLPTGLSISPPLPAGLYIDLGYPYWYLGQYGDLTGVATVLSLNYTNYTLTATNSGGTGVMWFMLRVFDVAPYLFLYPTSPVTFTRTYLSVAPVRLFGGPLTNITVIPPLPPGLALTVNATIFGYPTTLSVDFVVYTVYIGNSGGNNYTTITLRVIAIAPTLLNYTSPVSVYTRLTSYTNTPRISGDPILSYTITPALPPGLSMDNFTGIISGIPTGLQIVATNYTITAMNSGGSVQTMIWITILEIPPTSLVFNVPSPIYSRTIKIDDNAPTIVGGPIVTWTSVPPFPAGLSLMANGTLTGTATVLAPAAKYLITCTNSGGSFSLNMTLTVIDIPPFSLNYTQDQVYLKGNYLPFNNPSYSGGAIVSWVVSPSLPASLFISSTGVISGSLDTYIYPARTYVVTGINTGGNTSFAIRFSIIDVIPATFFIRFDPAIYDKNVPITNNEAKTSSSFFNMFSIQPPLPAGLTLNTTSGVISGTPTVFLFPGTTFIVTGSNVGNSLNASFFLAIRDVPPSSLVFNSNPVTFVRTVPVSFTPPTNLGGAPTSFSISPNLTAPLVFDPVTGIISGTPAVSSTGITYQYTATNSGGSVSAPLTIIVVDSPPVSASYTNASMVYVKGTAILNNIFLFTGGAPSSYVIQPALPTGLSISSTTGVISGTPTVVSSLHTYIITGTNTGGAVNATIQITVNDIAPISLSYGVAIAVFNKLIASANVIPTNGGGTIVTYAINTTLPAGLTFNTATGALSGTPTVTVVPAIPFLVTGTNTGGSTSTILFVEVLETPPSALVYRFPSAVYTLNVAIIPNNMSTTGSGIIRGLSISPALPTGLFFNTTTGTITGTPTVIVSPAQSFVVTATNDGGSDTYNLLIAVLDVPPSNLVYAQSNVVLTIGASLTLAVPTHAGGTVVSYSVSPALPSSITLNTGTGAISGTTTVLVYPATTYVITATNTGGSTTFNLKITVVAVVPSALTYAKLVVNYTKNSLISTNNPTYAGGLITNFWSSPPLPSALSIDPVSGNITGFVSVLVVPPQVYTIFGNNTGGQTSVALKIGINDVPPSSLTYTTLNPVYTVTVGISNNSPQANGGAVTFYSVSPSLPTGLVFNTFTGIISGTATVVVNPAQNYVVTATNSGGSTSVTLSITVNHVAPTSLVYTSSAVVLTKGVAITPITRVSNGGGPILLYVLATGSLPLPTGLSLDANTGAISGTPTVLVNPAVLISITGSNTGGQTTVSLTITVNDVIPSALAYSTPVAVYTRTVAITANTPTSLGGPVISYSLSTPLPTGMSFNTGTGAITGTPSVLLPSFTFTITATNTGGSATTTVVITVIAVAPSNLVYSQPVMTYTKGVSVVNNTPSSSGDPIVTYSCSPVLPAGVTIDSSTGIISGTPAVLLPAKSFNITATNTGGSTRYTITITVIDVPPLSLNYTTRFAIYTKLIPIVSNIPLHTGGDIVSYTITPALPNGIRFDTTTGIISGMPTIRIEGWSNHTITATNTGGSLSTQISITITDAPPSCLLYTSGLNVTYTKDYPITPNKPILGNGGTIDSYTVFPDLPDGLTYDMTTGIITGVPTTLQDETIYTIFGKNQGGTVQSYLTIRIIVLDDCLSNPCHNGGKCHTGVESYLCECAPGFSGTLCQSDNNECSSSPCNNGGQCNDLPNGFSCTCAVGYMGTLCDVDIDECATSPCLHGGTCTQGIGSYLCACPPKVFGDNCQIDNTTAVTPDGAVRISLTLGTNINNVTANPAAFAASLTADIASSLGVDPSRFVLRSYAPSASGGVSAVVDILDDPADPDPTHTSTELYNQLSAQLSDPTSAIRSSDREISSSISSMSKSCPDGTMASDCSSHSNNGGGDKVIQQGGNYGPYVAGLAVLSVLLCLLLAILIVVLGRLRNKDKPTETTKGATATATGTAKIDAFSGVAVHN